MKKIMILGAGVMQMPAFKIAKERGWYTICCDGNPEPIGKDLCDEFFNIDLKDRLKLADTALKYKSENGLDGVFTVGTDFSSSVAWVAEKCELPGISYQTALNATDKVRMRICFNEAGVPSPKYVEISEEMDFKDELKSMDFPLVVKPVDSMGARGVIRVDNNSELEKAIINAIDYSRTSRAIVEDYLEGPEYSIDSIVINGEIVIRGIADRHIFFPPCFIEMGHTIPSNSKKSDQDKVIEAFKKGVKSLGIDNGAAKGDVKFTKDGPFIGEIAARLSGGFMSGWTYPYSSNISVIEEAMEIALGIYKKNDKQESNLIAGERAIISIPGKIESIEGIEEVHDKEHIKDIFLSLEEGDNVNFPRNNVEKVGNIIASSSSRRNLGETFSEALKRISIILEVGNKTTAEYLSSQESFPPNAIILHQEKDQLFYNYLVEGCNIDFKEIPNFDSFKLLNLPGRGEGSFDWYNISIKENLEEIEKDFTLKFYDDGDEQFSAWFWKSLIRGGKEGLRWFLRTCEFVG